MKSNMIHGSSGKASAEASAEASGCCIVMLGGSQSNNKINEIPFLHFASTNDTAE